MHPTRPAPGRAALWASLAVAVALTALGLWRDAWWPLAGGTAALALAAWHATEESR